MMLRSTFLLVLLFVSIRSFAADLVVDQSGKGDFTTVQDAVNSVADNTAARTVIRIRPGTYREKIVIPAGKKNISFVGEDAASTVITWDDYSGKGQINTRTSYTVWIRAEGFRASNITFRNAAGPVGQAVAVYADADRCVFTNCRITGNQDTLLPARGGSRQLYERCYIEGTTDFIFGDATAVFLECEIRSLKNSYITAASTPQKSPFGFVFIRCRLTASGDADKVYLGRPWGEFARTVFIATEMDQHILPAGWHNWNKPNAEKTAFYAEYASKGPGGDSSGRVPWSYQLSRKEAKAYTLRTILGPEKWYK
jgi:pectinesterase